MRVPLFKQYYASENSMNRAQRHFYLSLEKNLTRGKYPSVDGQISYLFVFVYKVLSRWKQEGFNNVYKALLELAEEYYYEKPFPDYCKAWSYDCLIILEKYEDFLDLTEEGDPFRPTFFRISKNLRWPVFHHLRKEPSTLDIYDIVRANHTPTSFTKKFPGIFKEFLDKVFNGIAEKKGSWLNQVPKKPYNYPYYLFSGVPRVDNPQLKLKIYHAPTSSDSVYSIIKNAAREAENRLRDLKGVPRVGEGWIAETELFNKIKSAFPQTTVIHHGQPSWLGKQHLDIWLPNWKITVEYHGRQHFEPVDFFGGEAGFEATLRRDRRKKYRCTRNGVKLIVATRDTPVEVVIQAIKHTRQNQPKQKLPL